MTTLKADDRIFSVHTPLKGLVALAMVFSHGALFFDSSAYSEKLSRTFQHPDPAEFLFRAIWTNFASATPFILSGYVFAYVIDSRAMGWREIARVSWRRFWTLFLLDIAVGAPLYSLKTWPSGSEFYFKAGILTGFAWVSLVAPFFSKLGPMALFLAGPVLLLGTELIASLFHWSNTALSGEPKALQLLYNFLVNPGVCSPYWQSLYPALQWVSFYSFGMFLFRFTPIRRIRSHSILIHALFFLLLFAVIRSFTSIGSQGQDIPLGWMEFFQPQKYPLSLHYYLFSLSVFFFAWLLAEALLRRKIMGSLSLFGRHFTFCYLLHLALLGGVNVAFNVRKEHGLFQSILLSALVAMGMYPIVRWYEGFRQARRDWWIFTVI